MDSKSLYVVLLYLAHVQFWKKPAFEKDLNVITRINNKGLGGYSDE